MRKKWPERHSDFAIQTSLIRIRIPPQIGPQHPETQHVAVSHHGLRLIKRTPNGDLIILETLPLEDIVSVNSSRAGVCVLQVASGVRLPLHTNRAPQLAEMIGRYIRLVSKPRPILPRGGRTTRARPRPISDRRRNYNGTVYLIIRNEATADNA